MARSWLINREHIRHIVDDQCDGNVNEFVVRSGIDKNTARRWLNEDGATTYGSTVSAVCDAFGLPPAALAYQQGKNKKKAPRWLDAVREFSGNSESFLAHGPVLPYSNTYPIVRSWHYAHPKGSSWGLLHIHYNSPAIKLQVIGMKRVMMCELWFLLGEVRAREGSYTVESRGLRRRFQVPAKQLPHVFTLAVVYDHWSNGFLVRADMPFHLKEVDRVCDDKLGHMAANPLAAVATMYPLTPQHVPRGAVSDCIHCMVEQHGGPPVSGVVRRDGRPVRRGAVSNDED